jgi:hypothetical protein
VAHVDSGAELGVLSSGTMIADGIFWWYVKTGGISNWTSYTVGWVPGDSVRSFWSTSVINNFRGRMSQWGTRYYADPMNWDYGPIVHLFYDNTPHTNYYPARSFGYTPNRSPNRPWNMAPLDGAPVLTTTPVLVASPFSDPDPGDYHWKSSWQIWEAATNLVVWNSGWGPGATSTTVPVGVLAYETRYNWQVRYMDNKGAWSEPWPLNSAFVTKLDPAQAHYLYFPLMSQ